jgi:hypothetical protein
MAVKVNQKHGGRTKLFCRFQYDGDKQWGLALEIELYIDIIIKRFTYRVVWEMIFVKVNNYKYGDDAKF